MRAMLLEVPAATLIAATCQRTCGGGILIRHLPMQALTVVDEFSLVPLRKETHAEHEGTMPGLQEGVTVPFVQRARFPPDAAGSQPST